MQRKFYIPRMSDNSSALFYAPTLPAKELLKNNEIKLPWGLSGPCILEPKESEGIDTGTNAWLPLSVLLIDLLDISKPLTDGIVMGPVLL